MVVCDEYIAWPRWPFIHIAHNQVAIVIGTIPPDILIIRRLHIMYVEFVVSNNIIIILRWTESSEFRLLTNH